jgi:predicted dinucleotide-utilizing enzyme
VRVGLLGVGAIGGYILDGIARGAAGPARVVALADVPAKEARRRRAYRSSPTPD